MAASARTFCGVLALCGSWAATAAATPAAPERAVYTLDEAVAEALASHPRIRAAGAEARAAEARSDEAELAELPSAGVSAELNRSTANTTPGLFFPAVGFPPVAGPVETKSLNGGTWQSGGSVWASWDVLSLARQAAAVDATLAQAHTLREHTAAEQLEVGYGAADAFLLLLEAQQSARAAQAAVERADIVVKTTRPLVEQGLRPGVDLARAEAELAAARTLLAGSEQTREVRRTNLAVAIGRRSASIEAAPGTLLESVDDARRAYRVSENPKIAEAAAAVERTRAERSVVRAEFLPRVDLVAALYARGTGLSVPGLARSPADGIVPDVANWAAGLVVTWSALDIPAIRARSRAASESYAAAIARRDEVVLTVSGQLESASALLNGALAIARETPIALTAARAAEQQALARLRSALAPIVEVADAERLLAQAEINDAIARLEVRRAQLLLARAAGDLRPFLAK